MLIKYNNSLISNSNVSSWNEITFCRDNKFIVIMDKKHGLNMYFYYKSQCHLIDFQYYKDGSKYLYIYDLNHSVFLYDDDENIKPKNIKDAYLKFCDYLNNFHSVLDTVFNTHLLWNKSRGIKV